MRRVVLTIAYVAGLSIIATTLFAPASFAQTAAATKKTGGKVAPSSPVDLNTATEAQLVAVPGIGASTAKKIIAGRPYGSVSDLSKAGISAQSIKAISPMVKASGGGAPAPAPSAPPAPSAKSSKSAAPAPSSPTSSKTPATNTPAANAAAGGGPGMVWVNLETKVYHSQGDKWYGKTKKGKYMKESDAIAAGYRAAKPEK